MNEAELHELCLSVSGTIRDAVACVDRGGRGIALVIDDDRRLLGTITDGDVRRAMLMATDLDSPVSLILERKVTSPYPKPLTSRVGTDRDTLLQLMKEQVIYQIPLLDEAGRVADLITWGELIPDEALPLNAVIMAGGLGLRMRPMTQDLPKPMLPVGGRPLMEHIVEQLQQVGIRQVSVATHFMPE
jgi:CBS domain-containing protein